MAITTKKGDKGFTYLYWGGKVSKDNIRVEAYGTLDELCSFLGLAKSLIGEKRNKKLIESIQKDLFVIGAELATKAQFLGKLEKRISSADVKKLDKILSFLEKTRTFTECCFYLPGNVISSSLDIARTVCRRAERRIVAMKEKGLLLNNSAVIYLNRLSDLLYLLARANEKKHVKLALK
jgi:ATP:cob(I)alamin adenosyltransferase